jgi:streptomycin 6-kinase
MLFWNGDPTVRVLEVDEESNALLLERCIPGAPLSAISEERQDVLIAGLLRRLWRTPSVPHPFRPLSLMMELWSEETLAASKRWPDAGLVREGLQLFRELPRTSPTEVLLATDLHAGNILRAEREPWLVIDPKPFIGDPAYDATQHLLNCPMRMRSKPRETIHWFADLLGLDYERVRLWTFALAAARPRDHWNPDDIALARALDGR